MQVSFRWGEKPAVIPWSLRIGHGDARSAQDLLTGPVAGLQDLHDSGRAGRFDGAVLRPRAVHERLVQGGVELLADRAVPLQPELGEGGLELVRDRGERSVGE